jgi:uncharacterized protein
MTGVLAGALGLLIGLVVGTLGGGGGVLAVPALVYALGQDARAATTGSIIIVGVVSAVGVLSRIRARTIDWRTGIAFGVVGIPAAWLGSLLNRAVSRPALLLSFAALTLAVAAVMLVNSRSSATAGTGSTAPGGGSTTAVLQTRTRAGVERVIKVVTAGALVGFLTGFLGVGGGFLAVPALTIALGMAMPAAIGTSLLLITLNSAGALVARIGHLQPDWHIVLPFTAVAIIGALAGKLVADRMSSAALNRAFAVLLIAVGGFVGVQNLVALGSP